jgi:hypothetical protein
MSPAPEFQMVRPGLFYWQAYDPAVKTDLCCCALDTGAGLIFCDPVPLDSLAEEELMAGREARAIVLTNANHERNAAVLARRYGIEIWARSPAKGHVAATQWYEEGPILDGELEAVALEGFAAGETALWWRDVLLMGDALINLPPYGFSMLPRKYCEDAEAGAESLKKLLRLPVEALTFAHGLPLVTQARERLAEVIDQASG